MNFKMQRNSFYVFTLFLSMIFGSVMLWAQKPMDKVMPDFKHSDYTQFTKFMVQPYALTLQTLFLDHISDTIGHNFYKGEIAIPEQGDNNDITYYKLSRMKEEEYAKMSKRWFVVAGYIADKIAYDKVYYAEEDRQDFNALPHNFLKLVVEDTEDTVFYDYTGFWNQYNFPFTPMSYFNETLNAYPTNSHSNEDLSLATYDINTNYAFIPKNLVGEKLYLPELTQATYNRLYNGTRMYNYTDDSRKYSFTDLPRGRVSQMENKTFTVADWCNDNEGLTDVYLKLIIPGAKDTVYYKYPTVDKRGEFPFVVTSFLNKKKAELLNSEFVYRGAKYPRTVIDTKRQTPVTIRRGDVFRCIDFVVKDGKFQMLMRNSKGRKFYYPADYSIGDRLSFTNSLVAANRVLKYRVTYTTAYNAILQKELVPGMTIDMAKMSWGEPLKEVFTNFDGSNRHLFYMGNIYVIFKNNVLYRVATIPDNLR